MMATITALVMNVGLGYLLIFGKLGMPEMRIEGAAVASIASSIAAVTVLVLSYFKKSHRREFGVMNSFHYDRIVMKKLLLFGYPAGIELFLYFLAFTLMIYIFQSQGDIVATASSIMFNWDMAAFVPLLGIEIAVSSLVGRYMGAGDRSWNISFAKSSNVLPCPSSLYILSASSFERAYRWRTLILVFILIYMLRISSSVTTMVGSIYLTENALSNSCVFIRSYSALAVFDLSNPLFLASAI